MWLSYVCIILFAIAGLSAIKCKQQFVGQSIDTITKQLDAAKIQLRYRIEERDGTMYPLTLDYVPERLNFSVTNGIITRVRYG